MKINKIITLLLIAFLLFCFSCKQRGTANLEAVMFYKIGGAQPIARNEFYILDKSAAEILKEGNLKPKNFERIEKRAKEWGISPDDEKYHLSNYYIAFRLPKEESDYLNSARALIEKHIVKILKTDLQGKAQVNDLEPKTYYLFGTAETRGAGAIWNLPVEIKAGENSITIDQSNAFISE